MMAVCSLARSSWMAGRPERVALILCLNSLMSLMMGAYLGVLMIVFSGMLLSTVDWYL
jgi:hypothetical protein